MSAHRMSSCRFALGAFVLLLGASPSPAAPEPDVKQLAEARRAVTRLGGRHYYRESALDDEVNVHVFAVAPRDLGKLPALSFRCALDLAHSRLADADLKHLARHPGVVSLNLHDTAVSDEGLRFVVASLKGLRALDLSMTRVTDGGMASLARLPALERLSLEHTRVRVAGLRRLAGGKLVSLKAPQAARTDEGLRAFLAAARPPRSLYLHDWDKVTDRGMAALTGLRSLEALSVHGHEVGPVTRAVLPTLRNLRWLNLSSSSAGDDTLKALRGLKELDTLHLDSTRVSDAGLKHLAALPKLWQLHLAYTKVGDAGLEGLAGARGLHTLVALETRITDAGLKHLRRLPRLKSLDVAYTRVTPAGLRALAGMRLTHLRIPDRICTDEAFGPYLAALAPQKTLDLEGWSFGDAGLALLGRQKAVRSLRSLHLRGSFTDAGLKHLAGLDRLEYLSLAGNRFTASGLKHVRALPRLKSLILAGKVNDDMLKVVAGMSGLTHLGLGGTDVTDAGMKQVAQLPRLESLSVRETAVGDRGLLTLSSIKTLKSVDISSSNSTPAGQIKFEKKLPRCELYQGE